jgi:hypothetical protein
MAAVGVASFDLSQSSLSQARFGWALMFALVVAVLVVFAGRARYVGAGVLALGQRLLVVGLVAAALLVGARLTRASAAVTAPAAPVASAPASSGVGSAAPVEIAPASAPSAMVVPSVTPAAADPSAAPDAVAKPASAQTGGPQIEAITARGMMEADARGGVTRRLDRLQGCLADPKNQQSGVLALKVGIDPSGSVTYTRATGGELQGTPLGTCLLAVFYKMGFAAPASTGATLEITLRIPPP